MPIIDILIAVIIAASIIMGIVRGFVKEAISVAALVVAIWAALYFGPSVGKISEGWLGSPGLQMLFGRILVFLVHRFELGHIAFERADAGVASIDLYELSRCFEGKL